MDATAEVATANVSVGERVYSIKDAQEEAEVAHDTAVCIYSWLCEVCSMKLLQTPIAGRAWCCLLSKSRQQALPWLLSFNSLSVFYCMQRKVQIGRT